MASIDDNTNKRSTNSKSPCQFCGQYFKSVKIHISKAHPAQYRASLLNAETASNDRSQNSISSSSLTTDKSVPLNLAAKTSQENQAYNDAMEKWLHVFRQEMTDYEFNENVSSFLQFLAAAIDLLPGPKNPKSKYYEARKRGTFKNNNRQYSTCSNPERSSKNDRERRKEKYMYDLVQFEYFYQRRKAVRKVLNNNNTGKLKLGKEKIADFFRNKFETPNPNVRYCYEQLKHNDITDIIEFSPELIFSVIKTIAVDTSPGPDRVLMKSIRNPKAANIIARIANIMLQTGVVPDTLKNARTVLVFKGGDENDLSKWRPITICSVVRRVIVKSLDRIVRKYVELNQYQRGFVMTPGTFVNLNIIDGILRTATTKKSSACVVFLDISKAFDSIGHDHLITTIEHTILPGSLKTLLTNLLKNNVTQIQTPNGRTGHINIKCGVMQGDPISPLMFNWGINHILNDLTDRKVAEQFGFQLTPDTDPLTALCFADDIAIIGKDQEAASVLVESAIQLLHEIGLTVNVEKSNAIIIKKGKLHKERLRTVNGEITSINIDEEIKYLGATFQQTLVFNENNFLQKLKVDLDNLASTHLLQPQQKLTVLNQFIGPTLIYPFQAVPVHQIPKSCLLKADKIIKSTVKEILQLPNDTPNSMLYTSTKYKGLSIMRATWEAYLQQLNINTKLKNLNDQHVNVVRNYASITSHCLKELDMNTNEAVRPTKQLRELLRHREYETWCSYPHKGRGVCLFAEVPSANSWVLKQKGLSSSEWRDMLKMTAMVAPVRSLPGRSTGTNHCRHCSEIETLPHVLGSCPQGELLRINRHNTIRTILAQALRTKGLEVHEEVHCLSDSGSNRRIDIIAIDRNKNKAEIIDPTVRFETSATQPAEVDAEKKNIYEPTIPYFTASYNIKEISVTGLLLGARGTIPKFFTKWKDKYRLGKTVQDAIIMTIIKYSVNIFRNHLYNIHSV